MIQKIRGIFVKETRDLLIEKHGDTAFEDAIRYTGYMQTLLGDLDPETFYDVSVYQQLLENIDTSDSVKISEKIADKLTDSFGFFRHFITLKKLVDDHQKFWNMAYDSGRLRILEDDRRQIKAKVEYFRMTGPHRRALEAFLSRMITIASKKKVVSTSIAIDDQTTEFMFYLS